MQSMLPLILTTVTLTSTTSTVWCRESTEKREVEERVNGGSGGSDNIELERMEVCIAEGAK